MFNQREGLPTIVDLCPTCGQVLPQDGSPDVREETRRSPLPPQVLSAVAGSVSSERWQSIEYREPVRPATRESDVVVPALQALITGILGGLVAGLLTLVVALVRDWPLWSVPAAVIAGTVVGATAQWVHLLSETHQLLVKTRRYERPVDDAVTGPRPREILQVEIRESVNGTVHWSIDELPVSREQLEAIARSIRSGAHRWSRRDLSEFPGIGEERAKELLGQLEVQGYLAYPKGRNHHEGAQATAKGRALFGAL